MCSVRSCKCFSKVIFSPACYVDNYVSIRIIWMVKWLETRILQWSITHLPIGFWKSNSNKLNLCIIVYKLTMHIIIKEYGLQIDELAHDEHQHGMFSIYFVVCAFIIIFGVLFYTIYKIVYSLCGGKRTSVANIG